MRNFAAARRMTDKGNVSEAEPFNERCDIVRGRVHVVSVRPSI
jgi:hypothetical protein